MTALLFDEPFYLAINEARWASLEIMMRATGRELRSVIDTGCGPGWFAGKLAAKGLDVLGLEARPELVEEARRRVPSARFEVFDFDGVALGQTPEPRDCVLSFGLLYHLESPIRALRMLRAMTRGPLFLETRTVPERGSLARPERQNPNQTQSFHGLALVLTPEALAQCLKGVGFDRVYRLGEPCAHPDFSDQPDRWKRRDIFLACDEALTDPNLVEVQPAPLAEYDYRR